VSEYVGFHKLWPDLQFLYGRCPELGAFGWAIEWPYAPYYSETSLFCGTFTLSL
jgi:hypothetical protein